MRANRWKAWAALALMAISGGIQAQTLVVASESFESGSYAGAGVIAPIGDQGWMGKAWADQSRYRYTSSAGEIQGEARGVELAIGWGKEVRPGMRLALWAGALSRNTALDPRDPSNPNAGEAKSLKAQLDAGVAVGKASLEAIVSATPGLQASWSRAGVFYPIQGAWSAGVEKAWGSDPSYSAQSGAIAIRWEPSPSARVAIKAGRRSADQSEALWGVEAAVSF